MENSITIFEEARQDIIEIVKWYDLKSFGLGDRFIIQVDAAINKLLKNPEAYSFLFGDVRRIRLQKFPYIIFYKLQKNAIRIYGLIHVKRNPVIYKKRLKKLL